MWPTTGPNGLIVILMISVLWLVKTNSKGTYDLNWTKSRLKCCYFISITTFRSFSLDTISQISYVGFRRGSKRGYAPHLRPRTICASGALVTRNFKLQIWNTQTISEGNLGEGDATSPCPRSSDGIMYSSSLKR